MEYGSTETENCILAFTQPRLNLSGKFSCLVGKWVAIASCGWLRCAAVSVGASAVVAVGVLMELLFWYGSRGLLGFEYPPYVDDSSDVTTVAFN